MEEDVPERELFKEQPRIRRLTPVGVALSLFDRFSKSEAEEDELGSSATTAELLLGNGRPAGVMH
jgi:hypothetical protein